MSPHVSEDRQSSETTAPGGQQVVLGEGVIEQIAILPDLLVAAAEVPPDDAATLHIESPAFHDLGAW